MPFTCFYLSMTYNPPAAPGFLGSEPFDGLDASVVDFWRFAMSDLRTNNVRGYLGEFLVAQAVGSTTARVEWDSWDVTGPDGTKIEVKTSGFLQSWAQAKLSTPQYRVPATSGWDASTSSWSGEQGFNSDVYVFCLHTAKSHAEYDPLSVQQWSFYVAGRRAIEAQAGASMGLATLARIAGDPVTYSLLRETITRVAKEERPVS